MAREKKHICKREIRIKETNFKPPGLKNTNHLSMRVLWLGNCLAEISLHVGQLKASCFPGLLRRVGM
jgi:hypothetical protein